MPSAKVEADDISDRIVTSVNRILRLYPRRFAGAITIAAVKDLVFIDDNRLVQSVGLDIGHEIVGLGALHQREQVCQGMKFERAH
jgi:hypothetical protein